MPRWITEDPSTVYTVLGLIALALAVATWIRQDRRFLIGIGFVAILFLLVVLLDYLIVTDYERMVLHIQDMAGSVAKKDSARIFTHISDKFHLGVATKKDFRTWVDDRIKNGDVTELRVWDFARGDIAPDKREGKISFIVKGRGPLIDESKFFRCVATFALEPDGEWRMTTFDLRNPIPDPNKAETIDIPYMPR